MGTSAKFFTATAVVAGCCRKAWIGAGEGNRTLVLSLEGFSSTIELHPLHLATIMSGNDCLTDHRNNLVEGEGFEPSYS